MTLPTLPELTPDGQLYVDDDMQLVEAMLPPGPWSSAHGPGLIETPLHTLLCCWFAGTFEGDTDINIVVSRLEQGDERWSEPTYISHDNEFSNQNPSLFLAPHDEIWALYTSQKGRVPGKNNMQYTSVVKRQRSRDNGHTWSEPDVMFSHAGTFARQPIQITRTGRWLYGVWLCSDSASCLATDPSAVMVSDDQSASWHQVVIPNSAGRVHPSIVELDEEHLVAFMRSRAADWIYRSDSFDEGDSWSVPVATPLPNNNSGIAALRLTSGRILLAYNHSSAPHTVGATGAWPGLRCPISLALSEDGGATFPLVRHIERGEGFAGEENRANNRQYEYPCLLQTDDDMIHVAYAYQTRRGVKWVTLREQDIIGAARGAGVYNPTSGEGCHNN